MFVFPTENPVKYNKMHPEDSVDPGLGGSPPGFLEPCRYDTLFIYETTRLTAFPPQTRRRDSGRTVPREEMHSEGDWHFLIFLFLFFFSYKIWNGGDTPLASSNK